MSDDDFDGSDHFQVSDDNDSFGGGLSDSEKPKKKAAPKAGGAKVGAAKKAAPKKKALEDSDMDVDDAPKPKKTAAKKKASPKEDDYSEDALLHAFDSPKKEGGKKTVEEEYTMLELREHVLKRPDTYIGSVRKVEDEQYVLSDDNSEMIRKTISYPPGLFKIFDEILVNAADNFQRDKTMKTIRVVIDQVANSVSVYNDGAGIPVVVHEQHKMYVPEMIFGHLLTGSSFDDAIERVTGGRNGLGAKLTNIYSTEFTVETCDGKRSKKYKQTWRNNMTDKTNPSITSGKDESWTKITFKPDLSKFGMETLDDDIVALMKRRVYDIAGCNSGLNVYFNEKRIMVKTFKNYVQLYIKNLEQNATADNPIKMVYEKITDKQERRRWEICFVRSEGEFRQVSFVNSIATTDGGTHVSLLSKKLAEHLLPVLTKKNRQGVTLKPAQVKNHFWVFINCLINNPEFGSQTKKELTSTVPTWGTKLELSANFFKGVEKDSGVIKQILDWATGRVSQGLKTTGGTKRTRPTGIAKLDDANNAGTKNAHNCTLILTEGDSAKALAVSGLAVVGRDDYGVFPLRGKLLNVRDASYNKIKGNEEITAIKQILGLQHGKVYESVKELRYGHIMIMADQDHDGSHIKGLVINFIHHFWPSLARLPGFMMEFITPVIKAFKGKQVRSFYSVPEFEQWRDEYGTKGWFIKYYKGLGTSDADEAREYFSDLDRHKKEFKYLGNDDDQAIDLAFNKKQADARKDWLRNHQPGVYLDPALKKIPYKEFVNKELILFSMADCVRSIPSIADGWKPGQRKILYGCFKRNLKQQIKVAQLSGYISEHTAYHHGEVSLHQTIIGMAQNYVGSNNINVLEPIGMFGTRLQAGKDAASARYINTSLSPLARVIFHPQDDKVLKYLEEDGDVIEPEFYMPVIPIVLANGNIGVGTGWSSTIPNYNPRDITANLRRLIKGEAVEPMHPWYRGFTGPIEWDGKTYRIRGLWKKVDDETLEITELPFRTSVQKYKEWLEACLSGETTKKKKKDDKEKEDKEPKKKKAGGKKKAKDEDGDDAEETIEDVDPQLVTSYKEYHTDTKVYFVIKSPVLQKLSDSELEKKFKLVGTMAISNMHLFDASGRIKKYATAVEILSEFYELRLEYYQKRKDYLVAQLEKDWKMLENKVRFLLAVIAKELVVSGKKKNDLISELVAKKYDGFPKPKQAKQTKEDEEAAKDPNADDDEDLDADDKAGDYDYLLSMKIWSLTMERVNKLKEQLAAKKVELGDLLDTQPTALWERDLDAFDAQWEHFESEMARKDAEGANYKKKRGPKKPAAKKKYDDDEGSDDDFGFGGSKKRKEPTPKPKPEPKPEPKPKVTATTTSTAIKPETKITTTTTKSTAAKSAAAKATAAKVEPKVGPKQSTLSFAPAKSTAVKKDPIDSSEEVTTKKVKTTKPADADESFDLSMSDLASTKPITKKLTKIEESMEISDSEDVKPAPPRPAKRAASKKAILDESDDHLALSGDSEELFKPKKPAKKAASKLSDDDLDEKTKKLAPKKGSGFLEDSEEEVKPATKKAAAKKVASVVSLDDSEEEVKSIKKKPSSVLLDDDSEDVKPAPKKAAAKKAGTAKKAAPKKKKVESEEDEPSFGSDEDEDDDDLILGDSEASDDGPRGPRPSRRAASSNIKYKFDESDGSGDDAGSDDD